MKYNVKIDMLANTSHSLILRHITPGSKVLEFGPASGYMTKYMKEELGCFVYCVEIDQEAADLAKNYCEKMIISDIDSLEWRDNLFGELFDHIIFADVLEHLKNPWEVLKYAISFLKQNGTVLTSIPNICHSAVIMELLQGKFDYRPEGLLDSTHLRFFTKKSILDLLDKAGLYPIQWLGTMLQPEHTELNQKYTSFPESLRDFISNREDAHVYQYVTISKRKEDIKIKEQCTKLAINNNNYLNTDFLQIFWEGKEGFTEEHSTKVFLKPDKGFIKYIIRLPAEANGRLRLDPGNKPAYVEIKNITLYASTTDITDYVEIVTSLSRKNFFSGLLPGPGVILLERDNLYRFVCINNDPQLFLEDVSNIKQLQIEMKISESIPENISNEINTIHNELRDKKQQLKLQSEQLLKIESDLAKKNEQLNQKTNELIKVKKQLIEQNHKLSEMHALLMEKEVQLNCIVNSRIWRYTAPLRYFSDTIKKFFKLIIRLPRVFMFGNYAVNYRPLKNVFYNEEQGCWEATCEDPQFIVEHPFPVGLVICHIDLTVPEQGLLQFYFNRGHGFSEKDCVICHLDQKGRHYVKINLALNLDIHQVRFDPINRRGPIYIHSIYFQRVFSSKILVVSRLFKSKVYQLYRTLKTKRARKRLAKVLTYKPQDVPIDIIIPIYNAYEDLVTCVNSVLENTTMPYRLILIDDKSTDSRIGSFLTELESRKLKNLLILRNQENLGFVRSVNRGISESSGHVVLLNSDTEVPPGWLERLYSVVKDDPAIGTVTPFSNNATICSFPNFCEDNSLVEGFDVKSLDAIFAHWAPKKIIDIPTAVGFCMFINRQCLDTVGLFDEVTFGRGYGEENDFCMRAEALGFRNVLCPNLFVYHKGSMSFGSQQKELVQENLKKLVQKHPSYMAKIRDFIKADPIHPIRQVIQSGITISQAPKKSFGILHVLHSLGGGTQRHVEDLKWATEKSIRNYFMKPYPGRIEFIDANGKRPIVYSFSVQDLANNSNWLSQLAVTFDIRLIHVHHIFGYPKNFLDVIMQSKIPYLFTVHDYYAACPSYNLLDHSSHYCLGKTDLGICQDCLRKHINKTISFVNIYEWRKQWSRFLKEAQAVIAPSKAAADILSRYYPEVSIKVIEHGINPYKKTNRVKSPLKLFKSVQQFSLKVALLGAIGPHKGSRLLEELVEVSRRDNLPIQWIVIGYTDLRQVPYCSSDCRLIIHGPYEMTQIPELLKAYNVDLVFLPAVWPETYSYTLSEAWLAGYPVMATDLGALGQRVREKNVGWTLKTLKPSDIINSLRDLLEHPEKIQGAKEKVKQIILPDLNAMGIEYQKIYNKYALEANQFDLISYSPEELYGLIYRENQKLPINYTWEKRARKLLGLIRRLKLKLKRFMDK